MLLIILLGAGVALAVMMVRRGDPIRATSKSMPWIVTGLAAISIAGLLGLIWAVATMLYHDGVMPIELSLCLVPAALLAIITRAGFGLARSGRVSASISLLAIGAIPVILVAGFLLYLDSHPIDMR